MLKLGKYEGSIWLRQTSYREWFVIESISDGEVTGEVHCPALGVSVFKGTTNRDTFSFCSYRLVQANGLGLGTYKGKIAGDRMDGSWTSSTGQGPDWSFQFQFATSPPPTKSQDEAKAKAKSSGEKGTPSKSKSLKELLTSWNLGECYAEFAEQGFDDFDFVMNMSMDEMETMLKALSLKPGQKMRFHKRFVDVVQPKSVQGKSVATQPTRVQPKSVQGKSVATQPTRVQRSMPNTSGMGHSYGHQRSDSKDNGSSSSSSGSTDSTCDATDTTSDGPSGGGASDDSSFASFQFEPVFDTGPCGIGGMSEQIE